MPSDPWIPRADAAFRTFAENFCKGIAADPPRYMMTQAESDSLMRWLNAFLAAYELASNPISRTKQTIADKDDARSVLENGIRKQGAFIRASDGITDGDKLVIGVQPRNVAHNKRVCPSAPPMLQFIGALPGIDELRYHNANTPDSKAKPHGAARLELWVAYSGPGEPTPTVADARLIGSFSKSRMLVKQDLDKLAQGLKPTYFARWAGHNDQGGTNVSAWSLPCNMSIAARAAGDTQPRRLAA